MKYLPLLWSNLMRHKVRTILTLLSTLVAFLLFGLLAAARTGFSQGVELAGNDRLVVQNKISIILPLPESYEARLEQVPGVTQVSNASWFGGIYQDEKNFFPQIAVQPERFLDLYPEYVLSPAERQAWFNDRIGAIAGADLAKRFGWKVGDRIPLQATFNLKKDGSRLWELDLVGIYQAGTKGADTSQLFFHYDYLSEARRSSQQGLVGWYIFRIADPDNAAKIAKTIDAGFANSPYETKTTTEKAFAQAFANQIGNLAAIFTAITAAVFFTILLVAGNTMAQSVRERTSELAVLKTLGFTHRQVLGLVIGESLLLAVVGGGLGLALSWLMAQAGDPTPGYMPGFAMPSRYVLQGLAYILALGLIAGALPGWSAMRLRIVDALRRS